VILWYIPIHHPDEANAGVAGLGRRRRRQEECARAAAALQMQTIRPTDLDFICQVIELEVCCMLMTPHQAARCSDVTHPAPRGGRGAAARGGRDEYPPDVIPQGKRDPHVCC